MKEYLIGASNTWVLKHKIPPGCLVTYSCRLLQRNIENRLKNTKEELQLPENKEKSNVDENDPSGKSASGNYGNDVTVSGKLYTCEVCGKHFVNHNDLKKHINLHYTFHKCDECGQQCKSGIALRNHRNIHIAQVSRACAHYDTFKENNGHRYPYRSIPLYPPPLSRPPGTYPVLVENSQITQQYTVHYRRREPPAHVPLLSMSSQPAPQVRPTFNRPIHTSPIHTSPITFSTCDEDEVKKMNEKGYLCEVCGKLYTRKYGLKIHMRIHTGFKPLRCKFCSKSFGDPSNMVKHVRLHGVGDSRHKCQFCSKVLGRKRDLDRHIKSRHPHGQ